MQETRQRIVEIIKVRGQATVDELSSELQLTPVTIRHHLEVLRSRGLIAPPKAVRKGGPGRPQHVYRLADEADELFPKSYDRFAGAVLAELEERLEPEKLGALVEGIAERLAAQANLPPDGSLTERLNRTLDYLNSLGYLASVDRRPGEPVRIHIANCPYERVATRFAQPCQVDLQLIGRLLEMPVERVEMIVGGADCCTYVLPPEVTAS